MVVFTSHVTFHVHGMALENLLITSTHENISSICFGSEIDASPHDEYNFNRSNIDVIIE